MSLFAELRRRHVFRVAGGYVVVAWLLIEISDTVFPHLQLPDWTVTLVIALLILGLPVALFLAWAFDLTPDGIRRTGPHTPTPKPGKLRLPDLAILGALCVIIGVLVLQDRSSDPVLTTAGQTELPPAAEGAPETGSTRSAAVSIAVLPFSDMSPAGDQEYFSDGVAEEILNALSRVEGLEVASRTSSFQFKSEAGVGIPDIARKLGVRHVLEGSVRKAGSNIRVTAQLIDAERDRHVWSQNFDRPLTAESVFAIQDGIATAIVQALQQTMGLAPEAAAEVRVETRDLEAYELFLRARALFIRRGIGNMEEAIALLQEAVQTDPEFAAAHGLLAAVYTALGSWTTEDSEILEERATVHARRAIELDPERAMPYAALGFVLQGEFDWAESVRQLEIAVEKEPGNATAVFWLGLAKARLGYFDEAERYIRRCLEIDPFYGNCHVHLGYLEMFRGNAGKAIENFHEGLARDFQRYKPKFSYMLYTHGEQAAALRLVEEGYPEDPGFVRAWQRAVEGGPAEREQAIAAWNEAARKSKPSMENAPDILFDAQAFDRISTRGVAYFDILIQYGVWNSFYPGFRGSDDFKRLIRELRIDRYWREHGFPPQCRPVGEADFECR